MTWPGGTGGSGGGGVGGSGSGATGAGSGSNGLGGGGGGGGGGMGMNSPGGAGGSGKIILRSPTTSIVNVAPGSNTVSVQPDHQLITFNVSGTLTVDGYNE
jgi:hypothetical protein